MLFRSGSIHSWQALLPCLSPHLHLVAVDLAGHGHTSYPGFDHLSLVEMAQQLRDFLTAERLSPAIVAGHSAGAAIMLQLAADGALPATVIVPGIASTEATVSELARARLIGSRGSRDRVSARSMPSSISMTK